MTDRNVLSIVVEFYSFVKIISHFGLNILYLYLQIIQHSLEGWYIINLLFNTKLVNVGGGSS